MKKTGFHAMATLVLLTSLFAVLTSFRGYPAGHQEPVWEDLAGNIGPYKVFMHINCTADPGEKCGYYYYKDRPASKFSLVMVSNENALAGSQMTVKEISPQGRHTGTFKGYFSTRGINFSGTFTNTRTKKQFKFELLEAE